MKKFLLMSALLITAVSCDAPQRTRMGATSEAYTGNSPNSPTGPLTDVSNPGGTTGTQPTTTAPGFTSCNMAYTLDRTTDDLGQIAICQSSLDEKVIQFKSSQNNTSARVCLIATYKDSSGASTYITVQPQCTYTDAGKLYSGSLVKNRSGFEGYPLNGVMIMKENLLVEYYQCMDAYTKYISAYCPNSPNHPQCVAGANAQRAYICNTFKAKYPKHYLDIRLK